MVSVISAPEALPTELADALEAHGYHRAELVRVSRGPAMSRYCVLLADGRHLWVDQETGAAALLRGSRTRPASPAGHEGDVVLADVTSAGSARVYPIPWAAELLADQLTRGGAPRAAPVLGEGLGQLLREVHTTPALTPPDAASPQRPPAVERVLAVRDTGLAADDPAIDAALARLLTSWASDPHVALHGEPATGHVLVPTVAQSGPATPSAVLTGWSGGAGPAWFDVGHLLGDLIEVAHLVPTDARDGILALASAVRRGYDPEALLPSEFWERTRDAAVLKLLDHEARIRSAFGAQTDAREFLRMLAHAVLDPPSEADPVLAGLPAASEGSS